MSTPLRVLLVEDSEDEAILVLRALRKGGYEPESERVCTREALIEALSRREWDIILSDFDMPDFSGIDALACLGESGRDIPFVLVSGKVGEEIAVKAMRHGARDFVAKDRLTRLVPVVQRELSEFAGRRERVRVEQALSSSEERTRLILDSAGEGIFGLDTEGRHTFVNPAAARMLGYEVAELLGRRSHATWHFKHPDGSDYPAPDCPVYRVLQDGIEHTGEDWFVRRDGSLFPVEFSGTPIRESGAIIGAVVSFRDITERKRSEASLLRTNRALKTLSACNEALIRVADEQRLLNEICRIVVEVGEFRMAWVGRAEHGPGKRLRPLASHGDDGGFLEEVEPSWEEGPLQSLCGRAVITGERQIVPDYASVDDPAREQALARGYRSGLALPLLVENEVFGCLTIFSEQADGFDEAAVKLLSELASDLAFGLGVLYARREHERDMIRLEHNLVETIRAISLTIEKRDPYTAGHQQRVARLAEAIAREKGLDADTVHGIYLGGLIHDIGKIYVPAEILSHPGRLSDIQFQLIKTHPQVGHEIVARVDFPWPVAEMVLQHHERLDGSGYPQGLRGEQIIPEARILAVADVVEAMASHRPYRAALGTGAALEEVTKNSGVLYDPEVVDCCRRVLENGFRLDGE